MSVHKTPAATDQILIQITDTHLMDHPEAEFVQMNPEQTFHAVMQDVHIRYPHIDSILHTGDVAQVARPETYQRYQQYMQQLGVPFFQIPGNHDDPQYFPFHVPEPMPAVISLGNWRIILLNSAVKGKIDGWIQTEQLQHLKHLLQTLTDQFIIVACHHHPFDMQSQWIDQHKLKNTTEFTQILQQFSNIKAVICGHVHQNSSHIWNDIEFLSTPATCVQFKPLSDEFALDDIAPGYRCLHLKANGEFETQVHRLENFKQTIHKEISGY
ncbi:3',5'-cyclic-AMP phosphodiesterase [Acinetobacter sp. WZC-1]|uniref:3',5'-cyclic-AMP phosphodiesterase n=1 Tax=Acinetobacter sp. WZC-1 TaxID=3459034 RepID=UPI00403DFFB1